MEPADFKHEAKFFADECKEIDALLPREDRGFLRYVWTRSLMEWNVSDMDKRWAKAGHQICPPEVVAVHSLTKRLLLAMEKANVAGQASAWNPRTFFEPPHLDGVWSVADRARSLAQWLDMPKTGARPQSKHRLYFVSAMLPFFRWRGITAPIEVPFSSSSGKLWKWFDRWEQTMGGVASEDDDWLGRLLCSGGIGASDLRRGHHLSRVDGDTGSTRKWWEKARRRKESKNDIIDHAGCYIAWRQEVFKTRGLEVGRVGPKVKLSGDEVDFAKAASVVMAGECRTPPEYVMSRWRSIRL